MPIEKAWGERVLASRTKLGITQVEFARRLGCSVQNIVRWEGMMARPYSALAEWYLKVEQLIEAMDDEAARRWLGPIEPEEF